MRVARYIGNGRVAIVEEPRPECPAGGLLVQTIACGLCSGELMDWYMDKKLPHVLGHEVAGRVIDSGDERFPVGSVVFPHHHAPCLQCEACQQGLYVHCPTWRATKLIPGGMAEFFAAPPENLNDTRRVDELRPIDAALIEPLACVVKSIEMAGEEVLRSLGLPQDDKVAGERGRPKEEVLQSLRLLQNDKAPDSFPIQDDKVEDGAAVVGLGVMGLMHLLVLGDQAVGYDLSESRIQWASGLGLNARQNKEAMSARTVFVCPGSQAAFDFALSIVQPGGTIVMFAPLPPGQELRIPQEAYFKDLAIKNSYSCGPLETQRALELIREGRVRAEQVVSTFVAMDALPEAYQAMKRGQILKAMVLFE